MKKLAFLLALLSTPVLADMTTAPIKKGKMAGAVILYQDQHKDYVCGILVDKEGHIRHFITLNKAFTDLASHEVEPISTNISKDVYNSPWLDVHYWPKCPILMDGLVNRRRAAGG